MELAERGRRVAVTTTTAMYARSVASIAPLLLSSDDGRAVATRLKEGLLLHRIIAMADSVGDDGKARGLRPEDVDALWRERLVGFIVVEADGCRGLPLKMFGAAEPRLPSEATTVVVMTGMDALDAPLDDGHVHRARTPAIRPLARGRRQSHSRGRRSHTCRPDRPRARPLRACRRSRLAQQGGERPRDGFGLEIAGLLDDEYDARGVGLPFRTSRPRRRRQLDQGVFHVATDDAVVGMSDHVEAIESAVRVAGVVLAAGRATRMGGSKAALPVEGRAMVTRVVDAALGSRLADTVVVVGNDADTVCELLRDRPVRTVKNADVRPWYEHVDARGAQGCRARLRWRDVHAGRPAIRDERAHRPVDQAFARSEKASCVRKCPGDRPTLC